MSTQHRSARTDSRAPADSADVTIFPASPRSRRDSWTPQRQAAFLRALAASHNVSKAAKTVGKSRQSAYKLRAGLKGEPFDYAWDAAFQSCFDALAERAMDRALTGVEVPHYHKGELVGTSRRFDERLTVALLAMRDSFLRPPAPHYHDASAFDSDDFPGLVERVERGPEHWSGELDDGPDESDEQKGKDDDDDDDDDDEDDDDEDDDDDDDDDGKDCDDSMQDEADPDEGVAKK